MAIAGVSAMSMTVRVLPSDGLYEPACPTRPKNGFRDARGSARLAAVFGLASALGGCVSVDDQVSAEIETRRGACRQQTFRSHVERARCHNAAEVRLDEVWGADLAAVRWQTRLVIAEKTDRKQLTEAEAELEFAKVNADLTSQATRREESAIIAGRSRLLAPSETREAPMIRARSRAFPLRPCMRSESSMASAWWG